MSVEKSADRMVGVPLYIICHFSFVAFNILSLSSFDRWTFVGKVMWGSEPSQQCEDFLVLLFSSLWVMHPAGMGFDFTVTVPLLLSCCSFFFVFGCGHLFFFFGRFQCPSVDGYSTASCDLVLLQEEMSAHPSTLPF